MSRRRGTAMHVAALCAIAAQDARNGVTVDAQVPEVLDAPPLPAPAKLNRHERRREAVRARKRKKVARG